MWTPVAALLLSPLVAVEVPIEVAYTEAAEQLEAIDYGDVLMGRTAVAGGAQAAVLEELLRRQDTTEEVVSLLAHGDARVRTLALIALFDRDDPRLLPPIRRLVDDGGAAFPQPDLVSGPAGVPSTWQPMLPRTVGEVAGELVRFYLDAAGFHYGIAGAYEHPGWDTYWRERGGREHSASWFLVRLRRASGGITPVRDEARPHIREVRHAVDRLPPGDRELTLLWLGTHVSVFSDIRQVLASTDDLVAAGRTLGRERLLAVLRRQPPTTDPDLQPPSCCRSAAYPCEGVARFVLQHAGELLAPDDVAELLAIERGEGGTPAIASPWWRLGAAQLDRDHAAAHIEAAYAAYADDPADEAARTDVLIVGWRLLGPAFDPLLADRFWHEPLTYGTWPARLRLVDELVADGSARARGTLAALVRHPACAAVDPQTLIHLARGVNRWLEPDLITEDELAAAWHPWGLWGVATREQRARAAEELPDETRALFDLVADWRRRILESIRRWPAGPAGSEPLRRPRQPPP